MPFTSRRIAAPSRPALPADAACAAVSTPCRAMRLALRASSGLAIVGRPPRELLLAQVLLGGGLHHGLDDLLVGLHEVRRHRPLRAVPSLDARTRRAHVVRARG